MKLVTIALFAIVCAGCATIVDNDYDEVEVDSRPQGAAVTVDGMPQGITPTVARLPRTSAGVIKIEMSGHEPALIRKNLETNNWFIFGNTALCLLTGVGAIGYLIDMGTGHTKSFNTDKIFIDFSALSMLGAGLVINAKTYSGM